MLGYKVIKEKEYNDLVDCKRKVISLCDWLRFSRHSQIAPTINSVLNGHGYFRELDVALDILVNEKCSKLQLRIDDLSKENKFLKTELKTVLGRHSSVSTKESDISEITHENPDDLKKSTSPGQEESQKNTTLSSNINPYRSHAEMRRKQSMDEETRRTSANYNTDIATLSSVVASSIYSVDTSSCDTSSCTYTSCGCD